MGAIILFGGFFYFCIALTIILLTPKGSRKKSILLFILIPTWDLIIIEPIYQYYCATEPGQYIYKTERLDGNFFYMKGERNRSKRREYDERHLGPILAEGGELNRAEFHKKYKYDISKYEATGKANINRRIHRFTNKETGEILSEAISIYHGGGWVGKHLVGGSSRVCPNKEKRKLNFRTLFERTFFGSDGSTIKY